MGELKESLSVASVGRSLGCLYCGTGKFGAVCKNLYKNDWAFAGPSTPKRAVRQPIENEINARAGLRAVEFHRRGSLTVPFHVFKDGKHRSWRDVQLCGNFTSRQTFSTQLRDCSEVSSKPTCAYKSIDFYAPAFVLAFPLQGDFYAASAIGAVNHSTREKRRLKPDITR